MRAASKTSTTVRFVFFTALLCLALGGSGTTGAIADTLAAPAPNDAWPLVVCLGDSLTEGFSIAPESAYPPRVEAELRANGWPTVEVVNAGVSGSTTASAPGRLRWQLRRKPDVLLLALGANDGLRGLDIEESKKNLSATIDLAQENGIVVLLAGMRMPANYGPDYVKRFAEIFPELAREKDVALLPFLLEGVAASTELNLADGIHPNAKGYGIVARTVAEALRPVLDALPPGS